MVSAHLAGHDISEGLFHGGFHDRFSVVWTFRTCFVPRSSCFCWSLLDCNRLQVKSVYLIRRGTRPVEKLHASLAQLSPGASWQKRMSFKLGHGTRMCIECAMVMQESEETTETVVIDSYSML